MVSSGPVDWMEFAGKALAFDCMDASRGMCRSFGRLLEALPCMAFIQHDGCVVAQNGLAAAVTGLDCATPIAVERIFLGAYPFLAEADEDQPGMVEPMPQSFECIVLRGNGRLIAVQGMARSMMREGRRERFVVVMERMGAKDADGSEGKFLGDLLDATPEAMAITLQGRLLYVNREFGRLFGYAAAECIGQELERLVPSSEGAREAQTIAELIEDRGSASIETQRSNAAGERMDLSMIVGRVRLSGNVEGLFYTFRDISRQKATLAHLRHTALHDALTGLPNRTLFLDRLQMARARLRRTPGKSFAVLFLDLDGFKPVNDTMGHGVGDLLLLEIARRLKEGVRPQDTVARLGGDEFGVLVEDAMTLPELEMVLARLQDAIARPMEFDGREVAVSASIGVEMVSQDCATADEMLHRADVAMYRAKAKGNGRHEVFYCGMQLPERVKARH